jgi:hypothetical protein
MSISIADSSQPKKESIKSSHDACGLNNLTKVVKLLLIPPHNLTNVKFPLIPVQQVTSTKVANVPKVETNPC